MIFKKMKKGNQPSKDILENENNLLLLSLYQMSVLSLSDLEKDVKSSRYGMLSKTTHYFLKHGLIKSNGYDNRFNKKYYTITPKGDKILELAIKRMELNKKISILLED